MTTSGNQLRTWRNVIAEVTAGLCDDATAAIAAQALQLVASLANPTEREMRIAISLCRDSWAIATATEVFS